MGVEVQEIKAGWIEETDKYAALVGRFFIGRAQDSAETVKNYDSMTELHHSGGPNEVEDKRIWAGEAPDKIESYYESGELKQLHASWGESNIVDKYFKGEAIKDLLAFD